MNLRYENDLMREGTQRRQFRDLLMDLTWATPVGGVLDQLHDDTFRYREDGRKEVPAKAVLAEVDALLASQNKEVSKHREALSEFREYVVQQVEHEKVEALASKMVTQAIKAGLKYGHIQTLVVREMDSRNHDWPTEGW